MAKLMTEPVRLTKRVIELTACSRQEAEQYIQGGWVLVDGEVIDEPQFKVLEHKVELDPGATLAATEPATILLNKPAAFDSEAGTNPASRLLTAAARFAGDPTGIRLLRRHFFRLKPIIPLEREASGLQVFTQDPRLLHRMREDANRIEQEFIVEVAGEIAPYGLRRLCHGLSFNGRNLPPIKVSWQNEIRLRFALSGVQPGQLKSMCADVGLEVIAMKRIRIGRVPLAKMPSAEWRYLPSQERF
jgi:23S rRNA pseudouridine2604 synthase